jgi:RND family efflux transporter MFP subunit
MRRAWYVPLLAVAAAVSGCRGAGNGPQGPGGVPVKIEVARSVSVPESTEYVATLKSRGSAMIRPEVDGKITEIFVRAGARVAAGTPLMQIDPAKQQATLKSQEDTLAAKRANLEYARQQHERVSGLAASGIASRADLDQAKAGLDAAQAELAALEAQVREQQVQLHYYAVAAPMAGIVGDIPVRVGDRVTADTTLTTIDQPGGLEVYVSVPVERAPRLGVGLPIQVLDGAGKVVAETKLSFVSPQVDEATQTVLAKAKIDEGQGLRPAQFIRARVVWGTHEGPVVPVLAVSRISGQHFAFVAEEQKGALVARQRALRLGDIVGSDYVVLEGIKPGDRVIVSGTQFLVDGVPVSPQT